MPLDPFAPYIAKLPDFVSGLVSAGLGAWAAFRLEAYRDKVKARDGELDAFRASLYALASQRSALLNVEQQLLAPVRDSPLRSFLLQPLSVFPNSPSVDLGSLRFLLSSKGANVLQEAEQAQQRFNTVVGLLQTRSRFHFMMQERLEKSGLEAADLETTRRLIGRALVAQLEQTTDQLYEMSESALAASRTAYSSLREAAALRFPKASLMSISEVAPTHNQKSAIAPDV